MVAVIAMIIAAWLPAFAEAASLQRMETDGQQITLQFDDAVPRAESRVLSGPDRIAIDIIGATAPVRAQAGTGAVRQLRSAQFAADRARVVLDLNAGSRVASGQFSTDGKQLVLRIERAAGDVLNRAVRGGPMAFVPSDAIRAQLAGRAPSRGYSVRVPLPAARPAVGLPRIYGPDDASRPLVVIDAGHGGHDPGAINAGAGAQEKAITLAMARSLRDRLVASGRVRVALTRDSDKYLVLEERFGIARRMNADLFISIHADAAESTEANGATVYTLSEVASDREAARLAARENRANIINGVNLGGASNDVSSILIDLTQRETMNRSADFARLVLREGQGNIRFRNESHKFASFVVLKAPDVPSILLESGYISNNNDAAFLASEAGRNAVAGSVARAVEVYFARQLASR